VVLTPDLAGKVRASVQGGAQVGVPNRGFGGAGEDDGFVRPLQAKSEVHQEPAGDFAKPNAPARQGSDGSENHKTMARSLPHSSPEGGAEHSARGANPGGVGTSQVRAAVHSSQPPLSSRPPQAPPPQSSERSVPPSAANNSVRPPLQQAGIAGSSGQGADRGSGSRPAGGSTSARGVQPLGMSSSGAPQTSMAPLPRSTNYRGGSTEISVVPNSMLLGFMVSFDENPYGEAFEIREGRTIVSSDLPMSGGTVLLIEDPSVGSMHAVLKAESDGTLILLDQLFETGTFVRTQGGEEQQLSGDRAIIKHGDMVRFGSRSFKVSLLD